MKTFLVAAMMMAATGGGGENDLVAEGTPRAVDASNRVVFGMRWRTPVVRTGVYRTVIESFGRPALSEQYELVILGQGEGEVRALRLRDGREVWRYEHGAPFEASVTLLPAMKGQPEVVILTSRDGRVLALDTASGKQVWTGTVEADCRAPATLVGDTLLLTTVTNQLWALDALSGKPKWNVGRPAPSALTVEGHSRATVHGDRIYVAFSDGYVEAFEVATGARVWSRPLSFTGGEFIDADADPVVADGRLYVASYSDGIYALDLEDGKTAWTRSAPAVSSLATYEHGHRRLVLAASSDGFVWALNRESGDLEYRVRIPNGPVSRLAVNDGFAVLSAGKSGLVVMNAGTGRPLQATAVTGWLSSAPVWRGDDLAVLSSTGHLYAFSKDTAGLVE